MSGSDSAKIASAIADVAAALDALCHLIQRETDLVRAGKLRDGMALADQKTAAAAAYTESLRALAKAGAAAGAPAAARALRAQHAEFEALLAVNLSVLATVQGVSESVLREVSATLAAAGPKTYGPAARPQGSAPLALSRTT